MSKNFKIQPKAQPVTPHEIESHRSAWIAPDGTIYKVSQWGHLEWVAENVVDADHNSYVYPSDMSDWLQEIGWVHLSEGRIDLDERRTTKAQIEALFDIHMYAPKKDTWYWDRMEAELPKYLDRL